MPTPLDLKRLAQLEREMPRIQGHVWITQENVDYIGDQLRPMLDLIVRMGRAIENAPCTNWTQGCAKGMYSKNPGRWCSRCCGLEYYRLAGGS